MAEPASSTTLDAEPRYDSLQNPTFYGLLTAEFLAAFNDQCIHAAAMFFAISTGALSKHAAIGLMPLLFYTPWAIFAPLSGYLADKVSKRWSLIFWKVAEVGITGFALLGFYLGTAYPKEEFLGQIGPWIVMSCVFLMGTHSAFYVPNKYGVLPEIFKVRALSKANGLIESTTFLAVILGTTAGGVLSSIFEKQEYWIGVILVVLALIGTLTSLLIRKMRPADPERPFPGWAPWKLFGPLFRNLGILLSYRLSTVAILGLSFFTFMVAYMRSTMYMYGEAQNPPWDEARISLFVAVISLGVGVGSPLAGFLSGGKVELGLVPIGAVGMIISLIAASLLTVNEFYLAGALVFIGLFASFYLVPLYSLLQYSAPTGSKGSSVATNNFVATTGAILASAVFLGLVQLTQMSGTVPQVEPKDVESGWLTAVKEDRHIVERLELVTPFQETMSLRARLQPGEKVDENDPLSVLSSQARVDNVIKLARDVQKGDVVTISTYKLKLRTERGEVTYYHVREYGTPPPTIYNHEQLPCLLFLTAAGLLVIILLLLCRQLPDLLFRSYVWLRSLGKPFLRIEAPENLPREPAVLVTNCTGFHDTLAVLQGVVRPVQFLVVDPPGGSGGGLLRTLARGAGMRFARAEASPQELEQLAAVGHRSLEAGYQVAVNCAQETEVVDGLLRSLARPALYFVPIACRQDGDGSTVLTIGPALSSDTTPDNIRAAIAKL